MQRTSLFLLALLLVIPFAVAKEPVPTQRQTSVGSSSNFRCPENQPITPTCLEVLRIQPSLNKYAVNLFKQLVAANASTNAVILPIHSSTALMQICYSSVEAAGQEIVQALNLPANISCKDAYQTVMKMYRDTPVKGVNPEDDDVTYPVNVLATDNPLWDEKSRANFTAALNQKVTPLSPENSLPSVGYLNSIVRTASNGTIQNIITAQQLAGVDQIMHVILNAHSLQFSWQYPFDPLLNTNEVFLNADGTQSTTQFMNLKATSLFVYDSPAGNRMVKIPNKYGTASLLIMQPKENSNLSALINELSPESVASAVGKAEKKAINLALPKFSVESTTDMKPLLDKMGVRTMYAWGTDMGPTGLFLQKIKLVVQERRVSAAIPTRAAIPIQPTTIKIDRPFVFMIRLEATGVITYMGQVVKLNSAPAGFNVSDCPKCSDRPPTDLLLPSSPVSSSTDGFQCPVNQSISAACSDALKIQPSINLYSFNLLKQVANEATGNFVALPLHTSTALMQLCYAATDSTSQSEIRKSLNLPDNVSCKEAYQLIMKVYRNTPHKGVDVKDDDITYPVNILATDVDPPSRWTKNFTKEFNQTVEPFVLELEDRSPAGIANHFNKMAASSTRNTVTNIVSAAQMEPIKPNETLVLNGHSLQSSWKYPFDDQVTEGKFYNGDGSSSTADYMRLKAPLMVYEVKDQAIKYRVFRLPNKYSTASVVFVQPLGTEERDQTKTLLQALTPDSLSKAVQLSEEKFVYLTMPKFGVELQTDMRVSLQKLGVAQLFQKSGNLPPVGAFLHKAKFVVGEQRLSSRDTTVRAAPKKKVAIEIKLDHPFLFFTRLEGTGFLTYMGRVNNLTAGSADLADMEKSMLASVQNSESAANQ